MYTNIFFIPYRNRKEHLEKFINKAVPEILKVLPDTMFVVLEQAEGKPFNKGKLLNVGFKLFKNQFKYAFTNDVDYLPSNPIILDKYKNEKIENDIILNFPPRCSDCLSMVFKITHDCLYEINGFPNDIWGWGIEDRAIYFRAKYLNKQINQMNLFDYYEILDHPSAGVAFSGEKLVQSIFWRFDNLKKLSVEQVIHKNGISDLNDYKIISEETLSKEKNIKLIKIFL